MTKDLTDDELIGRITSSYNLTRYGGDVAELVRRYRSARAELDRALDRRWPPVPAKVTP